ncbi:MAG TPA: PadR family transcriptional regulator [Streptosporangiaceae bacterium]|nr:PadR family transcriptional regulator [Streptosporangiaceae bacterium]
MRDEETWRRRGPEEGWRGGDEDFMWRRRGGGRRGHGRGPGFPGRGFPGGPPGMHMFGPWLGDPRMRGMRGPRAKRGDVRAAALALLAEEPMNGYQIIQAITERSDGMWRPSPGSVYPALQQLEDEGLIRAEAADGGRRAYQLTDEGREYVEAHPDEVQAPWDVVAGSVGNSAIEMRHLIGQVAMAASQVLSAGTESQVGQAREVLTDARKALYRLLAADDDAAGE